MAIYEVETEDGQIYEVETEDDVLTPKDSTLPNLEKTEQKISGRSDLLSQFDIKKEFSINPMNRIKNELALIGGIGQRAEAAISNPSMELQKGNFNSQQPTGIPIVDAFIGLKRNKNLIDSFVDGASGRVIGELGDLVRNTGAGGEYNEALASTTGLLAALKVPDLVSAGKFTSKLGKMEKGAVKTGQKILSQTDQAVKDAITNKTGFLEDVQSAFYEAKDTMVDEYGEGIDKLATDNPDKVVNLRPVVDLIKKEMLEETDSKIGAAIKKVPALAELIDMPEKAARVSLKQAQEITNLIQSRISSGKLRGIGVRPDDIPLFDMLHDIKTSMVDAFPDIADLRKSYREAITRFNNLRGSFTRKNLPQSVKTKFGGNELLQKDAKELLEKDSPEILQRLKNYAVLRKAGKVAAALGTSAGIGSAFAVGNSLLK